MTNTEAKVAVPQQNTGTIKSVTHQMKKGHATWNFFYLMPMSRLIPNSFWRQNGEFSSEMATLGTKSMLICTWKQTGNSNKAAQQLHSPKKDKHKIFGQQKAMKDIHLQ